eukprot:3320879-Ditylum_brightwellii.AAC.1
MENPPACTAAVEPLASPPARDPAACRPTGKYSRSHPCCQRRSAGATAPSAAARQGLYLLRRRRPGSAPPPSERDRRTRGRSP